ncbi:MAG TPA: TonB-dependent receptor [Pyrinomonadaceae bacterium]|nr:TonB-dependent receptor [Pyrinomonadaceae bacterium]
MRTITNLFAAILVLAFGALAQIHGQNISGTVTDQNGDAVTGAVVTLRRSTSGSGVVTSTDGSGAYAFNGVANGEHVLRVRANGFAPAEQTIQVGSGSGKVDVKLDIGESKFTVSAEIGQSEETKNVPQAVSYVSRDSILQRSVSVLAQAGQEEAGLNVQKTSPTLGAIVVRGMTGKNVVNFVDGVRFTHSGQRGGINTFFNLNDPSVFDAIEVLRGPNGAQYGSDSLAGTVNMISRSAVFGSTRPEFHGEITPTFYSASKMFGSSALFSYGTNKLGGYVDLNGRRIGNLRTANGYDSHSSVLRFLGLPSTVLYDVNPETGFKQYGGAARLNYSPRSDQHLIVFYQRGQQDDGKRFDQLVGGDGNLIADLRNLMLDFGYVRYVKQNLGFFDSGSFTASYNSQREERVNQGGQGNPVGDITHQYERTSTWGGSFFLDKQLGRDHTFLVGGDVYAEKINSPAYTVNGATFAVSLSRPRVPDNATFNSGGVYVQHQWNAIRNRLRITGALRYSGMSYNTRRSDAPIVGGRSLWGDDKLSTADFSGRIGAVIRATDQLRFAFNFARGFRYPSMTDLGTLGLTGDGYEIDHITASNFGATIGTTASAQAVSTGLAIGKQESEYSNNFDASVRYESKRVDVEFTAFRLDIVNSIVKQAAIFPTNVVGQTMGDQVVTSQSANGTAFVAASTVPILARVNYSDARTYGVEAETEVRLTDRLMFKANYTYIRAEDKANGLPPNIEGGTPPPTGFLSLRYNWSRFWIEGYGTIAAKQDRLSSLDLSDRRTGAARTRAQIQNFFRRGACVRGLTTPGTTGVCGSAGGTLISTGETLAQVQNRLLPIGSTINGVLVVNDNTAVPLYTSLPSYGLANIRGGFTINENAKVFMAFENIFDQQHRNPSWGIDGAGRSFTAQLRLKF